MESDNATHGEITPPLDRKYSSIIFFVANFYESFVAIFYARKVVVDYLRIDFTTKITHGTGLKGRSS